MSKDTFIVLCCIKRISKMLEEDINQPSFEAESGTSDSSASQWPPELIIMLIILTLASVYILQY